MKYFFFLAAAIMPLWIPSVSAHAYEELEFPVARIEWFEDYNQAIDVAKETGKPIILYFTGSDWCGWCKRLKREIIETEEFQAMVANQFVFLEIDFPRHASQSNALRGQNQQLATQYNIHGYPTIILLDSTGKYIATTGYRSLSPSGYAQYLFQLVNAS